MRQEIRCARPGAPAHLRDEERRDHDPGDDVIRPGQLLRDAVREEAQVLINLAIDPQSLFAGSRNVLRAVGVRDANVQEP